MLLIRASRRGWIAAIVVLNALVDFFQEAVVTRRSARRRARVNPPSRRTKRREPREHGRIWLASTGVLAGTSRVRTAAEEPAGRRL
jgi:hypothetical protein